MNRITPLLVALLLPTAACRDSSASGERGVPVTWTPDTVAAVNGVVITAADLRLAVADRRHGGGSAADRERAALEAVIADELAAQRAAELGLTAPAAPAGADGAAIRARRRQDLAAAFDRQVIAGAAVSEAEARAWFEASAARIGTELRIRHILVRDPAEATAVAAQIAAGATLAEVARTRSRTPHAGAGSPSWELGWLRWNQVPAPWRDVVYDLPPGTASPVIEGPNRRYWIVEVVDRREAPGRSFAGERALIVDQLTADRQAGLRARADTELRKRATIVRRGAAREPS